MENKILSRKIKVCQIVSVDITLKFMLLNQLRFLLGQGYDVSAICSPGKWIADIEKEGIKVKTIRFKRKFFSPASDIIACFKLYFYFRKEKFDIVHTHTLKPEVYGQIIAKLAGVPIIINTLHGFGFGEDTSFLRKRLFILLDTIATRCSDLVFSISKEVIKIAIEEKIAPPEKLVYLGRDVDIERFNPQKFDQEFIKRKKQELHIPENKKIIGIVARLVAEKGFLELFEAMKEILKKDANVLLLVVGPKEPEKKDGITSEIISSYGLQNNIMFLGSRSDVEEIYALMDIFVLPSHREGLGASILEASAMEKPVIATNTGGIPEAVGEDTGILISLKNTGELVEAITFFLKNPLEAKRMGKNGREKIIKEFNEKLVFARFKNYYKLIIKNKSEDFEAMWKRRFDSSARESEGQDKIALGLTANSKYYYDYFLIYLRENKVFSKIKSVLDIGCGIGEFTKILVQKGFFVTAVDYSEDVVAFAQKLNNNPNAKFLTANIYDLPFNKNTYDMVICIAVFQHLKDLQKAISEIKRVLRPGGIFVIITLNPFSLDTLFQKENIIRYSPFWVKKQFEKLGFEKIKIKGVFFFQQSFNFITDIIIKFKLYKFLNILFPFFCVVSHAYYIEGIKKDEKTN